MSAIVSPFTFWSRSITLAIRQSFVSIFLHAFGSLLACTLDGSSLSSLLSLPPFPLKPPTPENLCRVYPRQSPLPPVNDFILVATLGDKRWESPPCFPPNQVAVMLKKSFEFSDVPYPPPGPGLEFSVQYRDVNGRTVVQWQTQPVSGEEWSLATPSHHTS